VLFRPAESRLSIAARLRKGTFAFVTGQIARLTPEMILRQAIEEMHRSNRGHGLAVNGIVGLDPGMNRVGIVLTTDILRVIIPARVYFEEHHTYIDWQESRQEKSPIAEII
jgi:CBS domain-containing protein